MQVFLFDEKQYGNSDSLNEMLVRKGGVRMNPEPKFIVSGLENNEDYIMRLRIELVDDCRHTLQNHNWTVIGPADTNASLSRLSEVESEWKNGFFWHSNVVHFDSLRITNDLADVAPNFIYVEPNHKYVPVLSVIHSHSGVLFDVRFDQLQFMAVQSSFTSPQMVHPTVHPPISQMIQWIQPYPFTYYPSQFDLIYHQPQYQFHQMYPQYLSIGQSTEPIIKIEEKEENGPEWNTVLTEDVSPPGSIGLLQNEIWAPQEMELEVLYSQTEKNYRPLSVY